MPDEQAPTDWAADVKRYVPDADDGVIKKIVSYCGIALRTRDASMVSFTDAKETDRVRENYCKKKLGLEDSDEVLDAAIAAVGKRMSDTNYRNRVTVYYLLAEHFGKLSVFGGAAGAAATAAPLAAAAPIAANDPPAPPAAAPTAEPVAAVAPVAAAPAAPATAAAAPPAAPVAPQAFANGAAAGAGHAAGGAVGVGGGAGGGGFIGLAAVMFGGAATIMLVSAIAGSYIAGRFDKDVPPPAAPAAPAAPVAAPAPVAPPEGAGVISEVVEGRPKVSVYFAVGKNDIAPDFTAAVAPVKAWLEANPADRVQLSGFTDPTGNAAANAELAKNRAQAVEAALTAEGVAADRIDLVKPDDTSDEARDLAGARRVEITVTPG
jgi:outer membrane protein OmpA-like peptidoglycan-associated protein